MRLELHLSMDGAAFDNGLGPLEAAYVLHEAAGRLESGPWTVEEVVRLRDLNGNRVGYMLVTDSAAE
jgi:hypothetical protein